MLLSADSLFGDWSSHDTSASHTSLPQTSLIPNTDQASVPPETEPEESDHQIVESDAAVHPQRVNPLAPSFDSTSPVRELVIVDTATPDYQSIIERIAGNADPAVQYDILTLDETTDGIKHIGDRLSLNGNVAAMHIVSSVDEHGISLGASTLDSDTINQRQAEIAAWRNYFTDDAYTRFHAYDLTASDAGQELVSALIKATNANIAAPADSTTHFFNTDNAQAQHNKQQTEQEFSLDNPAFSISDVAHRHRLNAEVLASDGSSTFEVTQVVPGAQTMATDTALIFSSANGNAITISDTITTEDSRLQVYISTNFNGALTLSQTSGLYIGGGSNGGTFMTIHGTESDINAAFDGMTYTPVPGYTGNATINLTTSLGADLQGRYNFSGNANDTSLGLTQHGTLTGAATTTIDVTRGEVLRLDSAGEHVEINSRFGTPANVTLSAWVNLDAARNNSEIVSLGNNLVLRADDNSQGLSLFYYRGPGDWVSIGNTGINLDGEGWNHVAAVFDDANDQVTLYHNGVQVEILSTTDSIDWTDDANTSANTYIGTHGNSSSSFDYRGLIDDVRIYNRALSSGEIAALAAEQTEVADTIAITISENALPTANADVFDTAVNSPLTLNPTANDTDTDGDLIRVIEITQPANGAITDNTDGTYTYTPNTSFQGTDTFDYTATDDGVGLQHYWGLSGNVEDQIGDAHGSRNGTNTVAGNFGDGLLFNETTSYLTLPDITYGTDFTISFAFKVDEINGSLFQYLYSHGDVNSAHSANVFITEDAHGTDPAMLRTVVRDGNDTLDNIALQVDISAGGMNLVDNQFHQYTLSAGDNGLNVYIDGILVASDATRGQDGVDPAGNIYLGARHDLDPDRHFGGVLDSVQIYANDLAALQVSDLAAGKNRQSVAINVADTMSIAAPATTSGNEDTAIVLAGDDAITIDDTIDADSPVQVTLDVSHGTLHLPPASVAAVAEGAPGSSNLIIEGPESDINHALDGLTYTPNANFNGVDTLSISAAITADLHAHYTFDTGDADDQSAGSAQNGTLAGSAAITADPDRASVLQLDGTAFVDLSSHTGAFNNFSTGTISTWVNTTSGLGTLLTLSDSTNPDSDATLLVRADGTVMFQVVEGGGVGTLVFHSSLIVNDGSWHHIAVTVDSSGNHLYIDGVEDTALTYWAGDSSTRAFFADVNSPDAMAIGTRMNSAGNSWLFNGLIDDFRIYQRGLSAAEIGLLASDKSQATHNVLITVNAENDPPSFALPGEAVITNGGWGYGQNNDSLILSDGSVIITPYDSGGNSILLKLRSDGSIDTAFGNGGFAANSAIGYIQSVAEASDGKILVSGTESGNSFLARYHANGTLDTTFGTNGVATITTATLDEGVDISIQPDGNIVLVGEYGDDSLIARFTSTGVLDASFGSSGIVTINLGNSLENLESVTTLADGSIIAVGEAHVVKLDSNGTPDTNFDADGILNTGYSTQAVHTQADGKLVVTGRNGTSLVVSRFHTDGTMDTDFGTGGTAVWPTLPASGQAIAQQADGKLIIAGHTNAYPTQWLAIRLNTDGTLDPSFATNGAWVQDTSIDFSEAYSVSLYDDGMSEKIVIGGYTTRDGFDNSTWVSVARLNHDGSPDTSLSTPTLDGNPVFIEGGSPVILDADVQIFDIELTDTNDFGGATLTLARNGEPSADDQFSSTNAMIFNGGTIELSGVPVATYHQTDGRLSITFSSGTTNNQVNEVMQSIAYEFTGATAIANVEINWLFDDGNTGTQGGTTAQQTSGSTTVIITNNTVDGTAGDDVIDASYVDPIDGDRIDGADGTGPAGNEDIIHAGAGADTISSGDESDTILGQAGDDVISTGGISHYTPLYAPTSGTDGTINGASGNTGFNYAVTSNNTLDFSGTSYDITAPGEPIEQHIHTVSQPVAGGTLVVSDLGLASGPGSGFDVFVDNNTIGNLVASGEATLAFHGNAYLVSPSSSRIWGDGSGDNGATITINQPFSQLRLVGGHQSAILPGDEIQYTVSLDRNPVVTGDSANGGDDADTFLLANDFADDTYTGGEGGNDSDTIDATGNTSPVQIAFNGNESGTISSASAEASFSQIENFILTALDDTFDASAATAPVKLDAGHGDDIITGGSGSDAVIAGPGNDYISTGHGADTIILTDNSGSDVIQDFAIGTDLLDVSGLNDTGANPVNTNDVTVSSSGGNALLIFPNGEIVKLTDISMLQVNSTTELTRLGIPEAPNEAPVITSGPGGGTHYEGAGSGTYFNNVLAITDIDSPDFNSGQLAVTLTGNGEIGDRLLIRDGSGVSTSTGDVLYNDGSGPVVIGSFSGGDYPNPLIINLNTRSDATSVEAVARQIAYRTEIDNPETNQRALQMILTDGDGGTSNTAERVMNVIATNDVPVVTNGASNLANSEGSGSSPFWGVATVSDPDSDNFDGGQLTARITAGAHTADVLSFNTAGAVGHFGSNITVDSITIGSWTGGIGGTPLTVNFNANADVAAVQAVYESISFRSNTDAPVTGVRTISIEVTDGDGGTSNTGVASVNLSTARNDTPAFVALNGHPLFTEDGAPAIIDSDVQVRDPELDAQNDFLGNYAGAILTLTRNDASNAEDIFGFSNNNGITKSEDNLISNGQTIATFDTTTTAGELVITFTDANGEIPRSADVANILRQITYANSSDTPAESVQIDWTFDDGNNTAQGIGGNLTTTKTILIDIASSNDAPVNSVPGTQSAIEETASPISGITISDVDTGSGNLVTNLLVANGILHVTMFNGATISAGDNGSADLTIRGTVTDINTTLASLTYTGGTDVVGSQADTLIITTSDLGNTGDGGARTDIDSVPIDIAGVNGDPAGLDLPAAISVVEDIASDVDLSAVNFTDDDAASGLLTVTLSSTTGGQLSASTGGGVTVGGTLSTRTFNGTLANLNSYFDSASNIQYLHDTAHTFGNDADTITIVINDNGNSGTGGGADQAIGSVSVDIASVNDLPTTADALSTSGVEDDTHIPIAVRGEDIDGSVDFIQITSLPGNGTLYADATRTMEVSANTNYATTSESRFFYFVPDTDWNGTTTFAYAAGDNSGGIDASPATGTFDIAEVNDPPVRTAGDVGDLIVAEDGEITDLGLGSVDYAAGSGTDETAQNLLYSVTTVPDAAFGSIVLADGTTTVSSASEYTLVQLRGMQFITAANAHGGPQTFSYSITDDGTTAGTADPQTLSESLFVTVNPVNDSPVITANNFAITEGQALTISATELAATDLETDDDSLRFFVSRVSGGHFEWTGTPQFQTTSFTQAQVYAGQVLFIHHSDESAPSFDIAVDDSEQNTMPVPANVTFTSVNDPPGGTDNTVQTREDHEYIFTVSEFGFSDINEGNQFSATIIDTLPSSGQLLLNGTLVQAGDSISTADINSGNLVFLPAANANGNAYASFTFRVVDDGGTDNGGLNTDPTTRTMTIDVTPINDAPDGRDNTITTFEDRPYTFQVADFGFNDLADNHDFSAVTITTLPPDGQLTLDFQPISAGDVVSVDAIAEGLFIYMPPQNSFGENYHGFGFRVHDSGGSANGGVDIAVRERFISFDVPGVNDRPSLNINGAQVDEGSTSLITPTMLSASDADDGPDQLSFMLSLTPAHGQLILNGTPVGAGASFTMAQLIDNQLRYVHDGSETSADYFDVVLTDGGENGVLPVAGRFSFIINEVIDPPPEISPDSVTLEFGQRFDSQAGSILDSGFSTVAGNDMNANERFTITIEEPPAHGSVSINPDGTFHYAHDRSGVLLDKFVYRVTNEDGMFSLATVTINIEPPAEAALPDIDESGSPGTTDEIEEEQQETENPDESEQGGDQETPDEQLLRNQQTVDFTPETTETDQAADDTDSLNVLSLPHPASLSKNLPASDSYNREYGVTKHNKTNTADYTADRIAISQFSFDIVFEITPSSIINAIDNPRFLQGLEALGEELQQAENQNRSQSQLATGGVVGASIGITAGMLAWVLRGGSLIASLIAVTPLWNHIDPTRVFYAQRPGTTSSERDDDEVEELFQPEN